jgi:predicted nucleic acid-binding protein
VILVDTGPLLAIASPNDPDYRACVHLLQKRGDEFRVPAIVVAETSYMIESRLGSAAEEAFLRLFETGRLATVEAEPVDYGRMADLVRQYRDLPLGATDASVVALAERLGVTEVATLDHRHFRVVRPRHVGAFTLLPAAS